MRRLLLKLLLLIRMLCELLWLVISRLSGYSVRRLRRMTRRGRRGQHIRTRTRGHIPVIGVTRGHDPLIDQILYFPLPLHLICLVFLFGELVVVLVLVEGFPTGVVVELVPLALGQELFIRDHSVLVLVGFAQNVLPHPLHFLLPFLHVILLRVVRVVNLVQLLEEQRPQLVLVPVAVLVEVVHLEEYLGVPVLGRHVVGLLPNLFQLVLGHRMVHLKYSKVSI